VGVQDVPSGSADQPQAPVAGVRAGEVIARVSPRALHVIGPGEIAPGWLALYGVTLALQLICVIARAMAAYAVLWVSFKVAGWSTGPVNVIVSVIAYGPLALSVVTLISPLGGWWWEQQSGGRPPSERERMSYQDALETLKSADPQLRAPRRWFVLDAPELNAAAYADTLMLSRGLLESAHLPAVIAHELGHLNSSDARLTAALHRMTTAPRKELGRGFRTLGLLVSGGVVMQATQAPWAAYWRSREHQADLYAARLGQGQDLAQFLEINALENDLPVPFMWLTETSHPFTEHRIDRLEHHESTQG
jgi:Zn-dependent protease with chaperone function